MRSFSFSRRGFRGALRAALPLFAVSGLMLPACGDSSDADTDAADSSATGSGGDGAGGGGPGSGGGDSGGGTPVACEDAPTPGGSALAFDGMDDHVTMGAAPELGLEQLTLEAWVRRDGPGQTMNTGVGGLQLVPIAGRGRGENDGSNVDCNYAFGFFNDVLGADFEDMATGANHPVVGNTPVPFGSWHHVAATYDGTTWRLYLDGQLDAEADADATPRHDSIQHFGLGAAFDSMGTPAGRLHGAVDEVRLWDHARTDAEIAAGAFEELDQGDGLIARWALDEGDTGAPDGIGAADGTVEGAAYVEPGAALGLGGPPALVSSSPADQATLAAGDVELEVEIEDADTDEFVVTFHVREVGDEDDFTVVVLPDTQYYTVQAKNLEHYFHDQTKWIIDNREAYNIVGVIHNGDIVDNGSSDYQWSVAEEAMTPLEAPQSSMPDGFPYGVAVGNHDQASNGATNETTKYNVHFGVDRFLGRAYYGGHYGSDNDESWYTFSAGGLDFVVVNLQFDTTQDPAIIEWARSIFQSHPDAFGVLNSHYLTNGAADFGPQGQAIYDGLRDIDNLQIMTCGHISNESLRTDTFEGNPIHTMLADYQGRVDGGTGWMRIWEFSPKNDELTVRTYSPTLDEWETDENSEFTLPVELAGAGGTFEAIETVDPAGAKVSAAFSGAKPGRRYEWYATISDCAHTVQTPLMAFTTEP